MCNKTKKTITFVTKNYRLFIGTHLSDTAVPYWPLQTVPIRPLQAVPLHRCLQGLNCLDLSYRFIKDDAPVFHHTRYRNEMIKICTTPYIAVWDVDVVAPLNQLSCAVDKLRSKEALVTWPYDGICHFVQEKTGNRFIATGDIEVLTSRSEDVHHHVLSGFYNGGIFFADREKYMEAGMENENIYGWGPEDVERLKRITILGMLAHRVRGDLYHLWHPRGINRMRANPEREMRCLNEYLKVCSYSKEELLNYIKTWQWILK